MPYHSNCNAMVCRCYGEEYMVLEAEPRNSLIYIVFVCLFVRFVFFLLENKNLFKNLDRLNLC